MRIPFLLLSLASLPMLALAADPVAPGTTPELTPVEAADHQLAPLPRPSDLPSAEEAVEQSVLPGEPVLALPDAAATSAGTEPDLSKVQPLPENNTIEMGASAAEAARRKTHFCEAKIRAAALPEVRQLKITAFRAKTDFVKRAWLRAYYKAMQKAIAKEGSDMAEDAEKWTFARLVSLSRPKTEPDTENYEVAETKKGRNGDEDENNPLAR